MVDSSPTSHAPPSSTRRSGPNSSRTCCAVVGLTWPNLLADGAATAPLPTFANSRSSACATGCEGQRRPTVSWPPVTIAGTRGDFFRIIVRGPGQKAAARRAGGLGNVDGPVIEPRLRGEVDDERMVGAGAP